MEKSLISNNEGLEKGNELLSNNDFFNDLSKLMENDEFKVFFEKYFTNWVEIKSNVIFMKLYNEIKNRYKEMTDTELDKSVITFLIWKIMRNNNLRKISIELMNKQLENNKIDFFKELDIIVKSNNLLE